MKKKKTSLLTIVLVLVALLGGTFKLKIGNTDVSEAAIAMLNQLETAQNQETGTSEQMIQFAHQDGESAEEPSSVTEDGEYTSKEEVAEYIYRFGHLPANYITKKLAKARGCDITRSSLSDVLPGMSIGGDYFGNYEGILPEKKGRQYHECDIDYRKGSRNGKRIIYSNDGLIYYTGDHYESFELLYGEE